MFKSNAFGLCNNIPNVNTDDAVETCALDIEVYIFIFIYISFDNYYNIKRIM